ncbi:MAG: universal stress protein [Cytophagales bacterium]|nr:universal stress protein [Cytophagales bacterium]
MKKILIPTDFSDQASYALKLACQIASQSKASIILMHIVEDVSLQEAGLQADQISMLPNRDDVYMLKRLEQSRKQLLDLVDQHHTEGVEFLTKINVGNPYRNISKTITEDEVDLIVMGTKGISGIDEVLIGSNTERVVRYSSCPVITVKEPVKLESIKDIVFAASFNTSNDKVVKNLIKLQEMLDAKLHLLRVNTPSNFLVDRDSKEMIKQFAKKNKLENYSINIYNDLDEEDGIRYFANEINADLIAMATHGRTGLMHLIGGSIAEDIVNHAKRPVWTCRIK